ncbi:hypothetical protein [Flammeovirga agarivorans]|uniref:BioF2-like acetyltransferase domain-containing protein n=1 Tax=Flammeovirga agarivorans TaxID=2726742 RepID=A0A7X8SR69_9BACT|nr:hypothetical protein [Flammeovirga agarivorans]NLR94794.1 hypothetical protein [Flammeovirga agarivorans]
MQKHIFFKREYMDYHKDRFEDFSLVIRNQKGQICALFPASVDHGVVTSHKGLTFGGMLYPKHTFIQKILDWLTLIEQFYKRNGITEIHYKVMPSIYKLERGEEESYALFKNGWELTRRDYSQYFTRGRQDNIHRSRYQNQRKFNQKIQIKRVDEMTSFWKIVEENLLERYDLKPAHSLKEIQLLMNKFPEQIKVLGGFYENELIGGILFFETEQVLRIQYPTSNSKGKEVRIVDALLMHLISNYVYHYIDFGHSCEEDGTWLNESLSRYKSKFGTEGLACDFYMKVL